MTSTKIPAEPVASFGRASSVAGQKADVLVIFGITGDLPRVMTFRSLYPARAAGSPVFARCRRGLG